LKACAAVSATSTRKNKKLSAISRPRSAFFTGLVLVLIGLVLVLPGVWLVVLGGSWYYVVAGLGFMLTGLLLIRYGPIALWVYALVMAGTLLGTLPLVIVFIVFGRQIIGGIMEGSVKA
jgi:ABC-type maltose transport system permease subunit